MTETPFLTLGVTRPAGRRVALGLVHDALAPGEVGFLQIDPRIAVDALSFLCVCIATGRPFVKRDVARSAVVWFTEENAGTIRRRIRELAPKVDLGELARRIQIERPPVSLTKRVAEIEQSNDEPIRLVILGTPTPLSVARELAGDRARGVLTLHRGGDSFAVQWVVDAAQEV